MELAIAQDQGKKSISTAYSMTHTVKKSGKHLSKLEQLPEELLEKICISSANAYLTCASPHLQERLGSERFQTQLVSSVLSRWYWFPISSSVEDTPVSVDTDPKPIRHGGWSHYPFGNDENSWRLPAMKALLRMSWLTPELLCRTRDRFFLQTTISLLKISLRDVSLKAGRAAVQELEEYLKNPTLDQSSDNESAMREYVWQYRGLKAEDERKDPFMDARPCNDPPGDANFVPFSVQAVVSASRPYDYLTISLSRKNGAWDGSNNMDGYEFIEEVHTLQAPTSPNIEETPSQLLRGPWTVAKGKHLQLAFKTGLISYKQHRSAFLPGLEDALREGSVPAILTLMGSWSRFADTHERLAAIWKRCHEGVASHESVPTILGDLIDTPWTIFSTTTDRLPTKTLSFGITVRQFELLFELSVHPRIERLGLEGFRMLLVLLAQEAHIYGTCSREEVITRIKQARQEGGKKARWGPWNFTPDAEGFVNRVWKDVKVWWKGEQDDRKKYAQLQIKERRRKAYNRWRRARTQGRQY